MLTISSKILFAINSLTIMIMGVIACSYFYYMLKNANDSQKVSLRYFIWYFALADLGFAAVCLRFIGFDVVSVFLNNILYIIALYSLWHGLAFRDGYQQSIFKNKWVYINVIFIVLVNFFIFYVLYDSFVIRVVIFQFNISLIVLSYAAVFSKYHKKVKKPADAIVKMVVIVMPFVSLSILSLLFFDIFELYLLITIPLQIAQGFAWAMALTIVLILDSNDRHYIDSITDKLSGLYNRRYFEKQVAALIAAAPQQAYAMILCDIDDFKAINDRYGHHIGDLVIQNVARCMQEVLAQDCLICRSGGEEFMIFFCQDNVHSNQDRIMDQAKTLLQKIDRSPIAVDTGRPIRVTISLGLIYAKASKAANVINAATDISEANTYGIEACEYYFKKAEEALYQAKHLGKNKIFAQSF